MIAGIVGLGLIGGSFAKAYKTAGHTVYAFDTDRSVLEFAQISGDIDGELNKTNLSGCDVVLICIYPAAAERYLIDNADDFKTKPIVIDCCGTKREVCSVGFDLAKKHGFTFVGGHPMAGKHQSGYKYAQATLYKNAPMVIVPPDFNDIELLSLIKEILAPVGFAKISVTTAEEHDKIIAFTSQLAHVVSNAYIKSPTAREHKGFSAGSYKDLTRVAWLNPEMWTELFLENKDNLIGEIDEIIGSLQKYRDAMEKDDRAGLVKLLDEGRQIKQEVDGR